MEDVETSSSIGVQFRKTPSCCLLSTYADELIKYRQQRPTEVDEDEALVEVSDDDSGETQAITKIPCGKECNGCPHGPYEYRVHREGKKLKWEYIGLVEG